MLRFYHSPRWPLRCRECEPAEQAPQTLPNIRRHPRMTLFTRRKPLAVLICCGFTSTFAGGLVSEVQAAEPLRVDPVLLGLPPVRPAETPPPAERVERPRAEVQPGAAPVVESLPTASEPSPPRSSETAPSGKARKASPSRIPARAVAPQAAAVRRCAAAGTAAGTGRLAGGRRPARDPREDERRASSDAGLTDHRSQADPPAVAHGAGAGCGGRDSGAGARACPGFIDRR